MKMSFRAKRGISIFAARFLAKTARNDIGAKVLNNKLCALRSPRLCGKIFSRPNFLFSERHPKICAAFVE
jgi:hypothetical protein